MLYFTLYFTILIEAFGSFFFLNENNYGKIEVLLLSFQLMLFFCKKPNNVLIETKKTQMLICRLRLPEQNVPVMNCAN